MGYYGGFWRRLERSTTFWSRRRRRWKAWDRAPGGNEVRVVGTRRRARSASAAREVLGLVVPALLSCVLGLLWIRHVHRLHPGVPLPLYEAVFVGFLNLVMIVRAAGASARPWVRCTSLAVSAVFVLACVLALSAGRP